MLESYINCAKKSSCGVIEIPYQVSEVHINIICHSNEYRSCLLV